MNPIDIITPVVVRPSIPPSDVTRMNTGSRLKNSPRLVTGIITTPQRIKRKTLGRDGFTSPVKDPRRMVGMTMSTHAMTIVLFLFLSENINDQLIEDGCERRNKNAQIIILALIKSNMRCRTSRLCVKDTNEYVRTVTAEITRKKVITTNQNEKSVKSRIIQATPVKPVMRKMMVIIPNRTSTMRFSHFEPCT
jgi:hypothetical protein